MTSRRSGSTFFLRTGPEGKTRGIRTAVILHNEIRQDSPEDMLDVRVQADWISDVLTELGYKTERLEYSSKFIDELTKRKEDGPFFVFNLMDCAPGEEELVYLVPFILDTMKIPYTGCSPQVQFLTTDKVLTKRFLHSYNLPTPEWVTQDDDFFVPNQRYIIKALREDASVGLDNGSLVFAETPGDLALAVAGREAEAGKAFFAERYIDGREFTVCAYGRQCDPVILPPYEWVFPGFEDAGKAKVITYDAKWTENTFEYDNLKAVYHFPEEDSGLITELISLSRACYKEFGLRGYARIDFRIDDWGKPWILEVNSNPSFYGFYNICREHGLEFNQIIEAIIECVGQEETKP